MTDTLFTQRVPARDLRPGMLIAAPEHAGVAKRVRTVTVGERAVIVNYAQGLGGRTFPHDARVTLA